MLIKIKKGITLSTKNYQKGRLKALNKEVPFFFQNSVGVLIHLKHKHIAAVYGVNQFHVGPWGNRGRENLVFALTAS